MVDFDRILAIKKDAQARLRAIPGVHAVGIGAKVTGGTRTTEPAIIVFLVRKKALSEIPPDEVIPAEIDGVKTDVIEADVPRYHSSFPDTSGDYRSSGLDGGIQIQGGENNFVGTLGCIGATDDPQPKIVAITCHHVVAPARAVPSKSTLTGNVSSDGHTITFGGTVAAGLQVAVDLSVVPTGAGAATFPKVPYVTTAADTLSTIATQIANQITALANPGVTAAASGAKVTITPAAGFTAKAFLGINRLYGVIDPTGQTVTFMGTVDPGLLLDVRVSVTQGTSPRKVADMFWTTAASDTLSSIATSIAQEMNNPGLALAFTASVTPAQPTVVTIAPLLPDYTVALISSRTYPAGAPQPSADLKATIASNVITLNGRVSGDYYGVYTNVNAGGFTPSYGTFINPVKGMDLSALAASIFSSLKAMSVPGVTFSNMGAAITAAGAEEVECLITSDVRVGQATNDFSSTCSDCCNDRIGKVLAARLDLDCAVVQLDPGRKYKNEVEDLGIVTGTYQVQDSDVIPPKTYPVQKRGRTTGPGQGAVIALHVDGDISDEEGLSFRHYSEAMSIQSTTSSPFSAPGDSGAAVVNQPNPAKKEVVVVGILFGGGAKHTFATPIDAIGNVLEVIVQTATAAGNVLTVPKPATAQASTAMSPAAAATGPSPIRAAIRERLQEAEREIASTPEGRQYATLIRHHTPETRWLIDTNRRVATVWQRSGGPQLVQALLQMLQRRDQALPAEIDGKPLADCIARIQKVLTRYGSPGLAAGLGKYAPRLAELGGLNYAQLLEALRGPQTE
jgi:hypothetical protein